MLAKQLAPRMNQGGSFVIFSGVAAAKIKVGSAGVAITNGCGRRPAPAYTISASSDRAPILFSLRFCVLSRANSLRFHARHGEGARNRVDGQRHIR